jgi:hypothetical protein
MVISHFRLRSSAEGMRFEKKPREVGTGFSPYINAANHLAFRPWGTLFLSFADMPDVLVGMGARMGCRTHTPGAEALGKS